MSDPQPEMMITATAQQAGAEAGRQAATVIGAAIAMSGRARVIFGSAPSQQDMLATLAAADLDWSAVQAFHMDEYLDLPADHPQSFGRWLADRLPPDIGSFDRIRPGEEPKAECRRYAALIEPPVDLVCMGIGVNGHIAFNEPGARFDDPELVRLITLDQRSRQQQVDDGCFATLDEVPTKALTVTIPPLVSAAIVCTVVGERKAPAVAAAFAGPVDTACPASILQRFPQAHVYLDEAAASLLPTVAGRG